MSRQPRVSIVMPTHNRARFLPETVASVLAQTFEDWEMLVMDDGSTDGTLEYLGRLGESRIRIIPRERCGNIAILRNDAVRLASGSLIAFLDSDDLWAPDKLALQVASLSDHAECGWSYTGYALIDERGRDLPWTLGRPWKPVAGWIFEALLSGQALVHNCTVMVRRALFEDTGGFDHALVRCQDHDLWLRFAERSPAAVVPEPVVRVRQHGDHRRERWVDVLSYMDHIYAGVLARVPSARLRRLCRRQWAMVTVDIAEKSRAAGRYDDARRALRASASRAWRYRAWWASVFKTLVRPVLPGSLVTLYHRLRTGGGS